MTKIIEGIKKPYIEWLFRLVVQEIRSVPKIKLPPPLFAAGEDAKMFTTNLTLLHQHFSSSVLLNFTYWCKTDMKSR